MATSPQDVDTKQVRVSTTTYDKVRREAQNDLRSLKDEFAVLVDEAVARRREMGR